MIDKKKFLKIFKKNATKYKKIDIIFWERDETKEVKKYFNYTQKILEGIIMDLKPGDCFESPKRDINDKVIVCIFKIWKGYRPQREIYIRLMIPCT